MSPRVSIIIPVYNEGSIVVPLLQRLLDTVTMPCEVLAVFDSVDDTTAALPREDGRERASTRAHPERVRARPRAGPPLRLRARHRAGRGGHDGRRQRRRHAGRAARIPGRAGRRDRRGVSLRPRRPAGRRPVPQGTAVARRPGSRSTTSPGSAPTTPPTRSRPTTAPSCSASASSPTRASRWASSWWPRPAATACPVAELRHDLARHGRRHVELPAAGVDESLHPLVPVRLRQATDVSGR